MRRWGLVTVALYALLMLFLSVPLALLGQWDLHEAMELFRTWGYWLWLAVLVTAQALLLLVPVDVAERRPTARRRLLVPMIVATFLLANLCFAGLFSILCAIMGDHASEVIEVPADLSAQVADQFPGLNATVASLGFTSSSNFFAILHLIGWMVLLWLLWGLIFYRAAKADESKTLVKRATEWLLRGSILELLIAVPSHIVVRQRHDCCAPFATFWGIVTGISVMLISFGPGVLF